MKFKEKNRLIIIWICFVFTLLILFLIGLFQVELLGFEKRQTWINVTMVVLGVITHVYLAMEMLVHQIKYQLIKNKILGDVFAIGTLFFALYLLPVYWFFWVRKE